MQKKQTKQGKMSVALDQVMTQMNQVLSMVQKMKRPQMSHNSQCNFCKDQAKMSPLMTITKTKTSHQETLLNLPQVALHFQKFCREKKLANYDKFCVA